MFRKSIIVFLLFVSGLFIVAGCEREVLDNPEPEHSVIINFSVGTRSDTQLSSGAEEDVEKVLLFGVNAGNQVIKLYGPLTSTGTSLSISKAVKVLYAVANPSTAMEGLMEALPFPIPLSDIKALTDNFTEGRPESPFLMSGMVTDLSSPVDIELERAVAKIEINGKNGFKVTSVKVENTPNEGYAFSGNISLVPSTAGTTTYTSTDTILYVAENTSAEPTQFLVTGTYNGGAPATYTLVLKKDNQTLDIERNTHYRVGIVPVTSSNCIFTLDIPEWVDAPATNDQVIVKPNPYKNGIKILAIGNSYSQNAMEFMYDMLKQVGITGNIKLVNAYYPGCTLQDHVTFLNATGNNGAVYERQLYNQIGGGSPETPANKKLIDLIKEDTWDVIILQQGSRESGMSSTYGAYLNSLISTVKTNANGGVRSTYKLGWHMTWTWSQNFWTFGNGSRNSNNWYNVYSKDQETFYQAICDVVQTVIVPRLKTNGGNDFDFIIPAGTAIHNARKPASLGFGDNLNYDGTHLDNRGCYIAAAMWIKTITGYDIARLTTPYDTWGWSYYDGDLGTNLTVNEVTIARTEDAVPNWMPQTRASFEIIRKAVNAAAATPFEITPYIDLTP